MRLARADGDALNVTTCGGTPFHLPATFEINHAIVSAFCYQFYHILLVHEIIHSCLDDAPIIALDCFPMQQMRGVSKGYKRLKCSNIPRIRAPKAPLHSWR